MKNFITILALTLIMSTGLMSCAALEGFFGEGTVFTTSDQLLEGEVGAIIPFDQLPDSVKEKIPEGTSLVMASKEQLKVDAAFVPAGGEIDGEAVGGIIDSVFGIATAFIPGLAAWEGIVTLFSTRKRKHYANAVKAIVPTDKKVDIGGALGSVMSALGVSHSSPDTAAAFEEEGWEYEEEENVI